MIIKTKTLSIKRNFQFVFCCCWVDFYIVHHCGRKLRDGCVLSCFLPSASVFIFLLQILSPFYWSSLLPCTLIWKANIGCPLAPLGLTEQILSSLSSASPHLREPLPLFCPLLPYLLPFGKPWSRKPRVLAVLVKGCSPSLAFLQSDWIKGGS